MAMSERHVLASFGASPTTQAVGSSIARTSHRCVVTICASLRAHSSSKRQLERARARGVAYSAQRSRALLTSDLNAFERGKMY